MNKLNCIVLCGGASVESDISLITGLQAFNALDEAKYNKYLIYIDKDNVWWLCKYVKEPKDILTAKKIKVVVLFGNNNLFLIKGSKLKLKCELHIAVLCLHGGLGESGVVAGLLESCNIAYTSCSVYGGVLTMDKCITKTMLKGYGFDILPYQIIKKYDYFTDFDAEISEIRENVGFPCIVKPSTLGSSIGIKIANNELELKTAIEDAFIYDDKLLVEKALNDFYELNISARALNGKVLLSSIEKPIKNDGILSFSDKYLGGVKGGKKLKGTKGMQNLSREMPAIIDVEIENKVRKFTKKIYNLFDLKGVIRCDYLVKGDNVYLNEVNSIPGSLSNYLWSSISFGKLLDEEIDTAIKYNLSKKDLIKTFDSSIFN